MEAAHKVYQNDDVFRSVVQHCQKSTLVKLVMVEQKGSVFDECVKGLYREVDYAVIKDFLRDTPRRSQYLDSIITVRSDAVEIDQSRYCPPLFPNKINDHAAPCSPTAIGFLRLKCPNLRLITRHEGGRGGQRFTIILEKGKHTGIVRFHEHLNIAPRTLQQQVQAPDIAMPIRWQGWSIKHTVSLAVMESSVTPGQQRNDAMKALLMDTDHLDRRITEIQTGWLPFKLSELSDIAASRHPNKNIISRINSTVEPFDIEQFRQFIATAGRNLYHLHLHTQPNPSDITLKDLPSIVRLIRTECPKLVDLRLPMSFKLRGTIIDDRSVNVPPYEVATGPGKVKRLTILAYDLGDRSRRDLFESCYFNVARNLACLLAPDFELYLTVGPTTGPDIYLPQTGLPLLSFREFGESFKAAIKFFQRLGPILEPHFMTRSLDCYGLDAFFQLKYLEYDRSGTPVKFSQVPYSKTRSWDFYCVAQGYTWEYNEYLDQSDEDYLDQYDQDDYDPWQEDLDQCEQENDDYHQSLEDEQGDAWSERLDQINAIRTTSNSSKRKTTGISSIANKRGKHTTTSSSDARQTR